MSPTKRNTPALTIVTILALVLAIAFAWPLLQSNASPNQVDTNESLSSPASHEQLRIATNLSDAFKQVAKSLRESVVSISSVKRSEPIARSLPRANPQVPPEFRQFFGDDDLFDKFFETPLQPREFEQRGQGTGFIVRKDGYLVTNNHVVSGASEIRVTLWDDRQFGAQVVGSDKATDIAVLKIDADRLTPVKFGDSGELEVGEWVLAIGSPFGLNQTVTAGIISATGRVNVGITDYEDFIQTDAAINPGNSGGPLVNLKGEVVGVNTAIASRNGGYQGIGFAIPSLMVRHVMNSIMTDGKVTRGWLGAAIQDLNSDLAASFDFDSTNGVLIGDVVKGGPADKAGLQAGDIIVQLDGKQVSNVNQLRNAIAATDPRHNSQIEVFRDGKRKTVMVEIGELEPDASTTAGSPESAADLGMTVESLTAETAQSLGISASQKGVVVTQVEPSGLAARAGIQPKDVIVAVGDQGVESIADFREAMKDQDPAKGVRLRAERDGIRRFVFIKAR